MEVGAEAGQGRWGSGYVETVNLSDPERAFEQINVRCRGRMHAAIAT